MTMPLQAKALRKKLLEFERLAHLCWCPPLVFCTSCTCSAVVLYAGDTPVNGGHLGHTGRHLVHQALAEGGNRSTDLAGVFHTVLGFKMTKKTI